MMCTRECEEGSISIDYNTPWRDLAGSKSLRAECVIPAQIQTMGEL